MEVKWTLNDACDLHLQSNGQALEEERQAGVCPAWGER